jgi:hypothetical protein
MTFHELEHLFWALSSALIAAAIAGALHIYQLTQRRRKPTSKQQLFAGMFWRVK